MKDDQCGVPRSRGDQRLEVRKQITSDDLRWLGLSDANGPPQVFRSFVLARPNECLQPCHLLARRKIDRVKIEA